MKIYVNRVPEEGLSDRALYDPAPLDMAREDIRLPEPFEVETFVTKVDEELVVKAAIRCPLHMICARCLEEFIWTVETDALFSYTVQPSDVVDITDDVRQEIILAYPMIPICRPTCQGLCPVCGRNRNGAPCGHRTEAGSEGDDEPSGGSIAI